MKQFAVIGLGDFGTYLALSLEELGNQVLAIDIDKRVIEGIKDKVTHAVIADVRDKKALVEIISSDIDGVIISMGKLEENVLATLHVKEQGVENIYVKPTTEEHGVVLKAIGAKEIIYPDREMGKSLAMRLTNPNFMEQMGLIEGYSMIEVALPEKMIGRKLREIDARKKFGLLIIAVKDVLRGETYFVPEPDFVMSADMSLFVIGKNDDIKKFKDFKG